MEFYNIYLDLRFVVVSLVCCNNTLNSRHSVLYMSVCLSWLKCYLQLCAANWMNRRQTNLTEQIDGSTRIRLIIWIGWLQSACKIHTHMYSLKWNFEQFTHTHKTKCAREWERLAGFVNLLEFRLHLKHTHTNTSTPAHTGTSTDTLIYRQCRTGRKRLHFDTAIQYHIKIWEWLINVTDTPTTHCCTAARYGCVVCSCLRCERYICRRVR